MTGAAAGEGAGREADADAGRGGGADPDRGGGDSGPVSSWEPGRRSVVLLNVGGLILTVVGVAAFLGLFTVTGGGGTIQLSGGGLLAAVGALLAVCVVTGIVHEGVHGLAMRPFGARPVYSAGVIHRVMPYLSCSAPGHLFRPAPYVWIALAPMIVLSAAFGGLVVWAPWGGLWALAGGIHLGGCIGDFALSAVVLRRGRGRLVEDTGAGLRIWPASAAGWRASAVGRRASAAGAGRSRRDIRLG